MSHHVIVRGGLCMKEVLIILNWHVHWILLVRMQTHRLLGAWLNLFVKQRNWVLTAEVSRVAHVYVIWSNILGAIFWLIVILWSNFGICSLLFFTQLQQILGWLLSTWISQQNLFAMGFIWDISFYRFLWNLIRLDCRLLRRLFFINWCFFRIKRLSDFPQIEVVTVDLVWRIPAWT